MHDRLTFSPRTGALVTLHVGHGSATSRSIIKVRTVARD